MRIRRDKDRGASTSFSIVAKALAALTVAGGVLIHFVGYIHNQTYLGTSGIDPELFPKTVEWFGVRGYLAMFTQISDWQELLKENWLDLIEMSLVIVFCFLAFAFLKNKDKQIDAYVDTFSKPIRLLVACLMMLIGLVGFIPSALLVTKTLLAIPVWLGGQSGRDAAEQDLVKFIQCDSKKTYISISKGGKLIAEGFLIDTSATHVALYVPKGESVRVIPIEGLEFVINGKRDSQCSKVPHQQGAAGN